MREEERTPEATLLQMIAAFGKVSAANPVGDAPADRTIQVVVNIFQAGAIAAPFTLGHGVNMSDQYNVSAAGAVGRNASAADFTINQGNRVENVTLDLDALAAELSTLRASLRQRADSVEQDAAVVHVGHAQLAAEAGDEAATLSHLRSAGKWAGGIATSIGTGVAAGAIKTALGL